MRAHSGANSQAPTGPGQAGYGRTDPKGLPEASGGRPAWVSPGWYVPDSPVHGGSPWTYLDGPIDGVHCIEYLGCGGQGQTVTDIPFRPGLYWLGERGALRDRASYAQLREGSFIPYSREIVRKPAGSVG